MQSIRGLMLALAHVLSISIVATSARAEEDLLAPCSAVADFLREFADVNPEEATSEVGFPYNALKQLNADTNIGFMPPQDYDSLETVEAALTPLKIDEGNRVFMQDVSMSPADRWWVVDARSLGDRLAFSQVGGSASCYRVAIFDTTGDGLRPAFSGNFGEGDVCAGFGTSFDVLRVADLAYPVIWGGLAEGTSYQFRMSLLGRSGDDIQSAPTECAVIVDFSVTSPRTNWSAGASFDDHQLAAKLKIIIEEAIGQDLAVTSRLKPYFAKPEGSYQTDLFQRLAARNDPYSQPADRLSYDEERQLVSVLPHDDWPIEGDYRAIEIDGQNVILAFGNRSMGWRSRSFPSLQAWKWIGKGGVTLLSVEFQTLGTKPTIKVYAGEETPPE
ncbi:MAG: hypothetical protein JNL25_14560 [Rhodospirillaceae bacterium]|nr:hypothetical protein [Rhodospirillaceae bacterium]